MNDYIRFKIGCSIWAILFSIIDVFAFMYSSEVGISCYIISSILMSIMTMELTNPVKVDTAGIQTGYILFKGGMVILNILYIFLCVNIISINDVHKEMTDSSDGVNYKDLDFGRNCLMIFLIIPLFPMCIFCRRIEYIYTFILIESFIIITISLMCFCFSTDKDNYKFKLWQLSMPIYLCGYAIYQSIRIVFFILNILTFWLIDAIPKLVKWLINVMFGIKISKSTSNKSDKKEVNNTPVRFWN